MRRIVVRPTIDHVQMTYNHDITTSTYFNCDIVDLKIHPIRLHYVIIRFSKISISLSYYTHFLDSDLTTFYFTPTLVCFYKTVSPAVRCTIQPLNL